MVEKIDPIARLRQESANKLAEKMNKLNAHIVEKLRADHPDTYNTIIKTLDDEAAAAKEKAARKRAEKKRAQKETEQNLSTPTPSFSHEQ